MYWAASGSVWDTENTTMEKTEMLCPRTAWWEQTANSRSTHDSALGSEGPREPLSGTLEVKKRLASRWNTWVEMPRMHWEPETGVPWSLVNISSRKLFSVATTVFWDSEIIVEEMGRFWKQRLWVSVAKRFLPAVTAVVHRNSQRLGLHAQDQAQQSPPQHWEGRGWWSSTPS